MKPKKKLDPYTLERCIAVVRKYESENFCAWKAASTILGRLRRLARKK